MREIGLYIHIPFCKSKCNYCDFYSLSCPQSDKIADYVSELEVDAIVIMGAGDICKLKEYLK